MRSVVPETLFDLLAEEGFRPQFREGDTEIAIKCPLCNDEKPRLYVMASSGAWICFRCEEKGSLLELLVDILGIDLSTAITERAKLRAPQLREFNFVKEERIEIPQVELPKGFHLLKGGPALETARFLAYLDRRGIPEQRAVEFGLGYCQDGLYAERIIVPVYRGRILYTFVARSIAVLEPKKVLYPAHSAPSETLYNYDHVLQNTLGPRPILVEGVFDVLRHLWDTAMAVLGRNLSPTQVKLLRQGPWGQRGIHIMFDGDEAGRRGAKEAAEKLAGALIPCSICSLPEGVDPGSATARQVATALAKARDYMV